MHNETEKLYIAVGTEMFHAHKWALAGHVGSGLFMESIQASGLNSALGIIELSAQTPLEFSKQGPVIRMPRSVELHLSWGGHRVLCF
jgi:hypothetical protein